MKPTVSVQASSAETRRPWSGGKGQSVKQLLPHVERALKALGGKWKAPIVLALHHADGCLRFVQMKRALPAISQRMLTRQLRELEACGVLVRKVRRTNPPWTDYAITARGTPCGRSSKRWSSGAGRMAYDRINPGCSPNKTHHTNEAIR